MSMSVLMAVREEIAGLELETSVQVKRGHGDFPLYAPADLNCGGYQVGHSDGPSLEGRLRRDPR